VRRDLSEAQRAVQAVHAVLEAARAGVIGREGEHPHVVLCAAGSIEALLRASDRLKGLSIGHRVFCEPDLDGAPTALATEPVRELSLRAQFRRFPLLKE
jgi:hypothetical protein